MNVFWLFVLSFLPGLLVCCLVVRLDKYEKESFVALALAYLAGAAVTLPSVAIQQVAFESTWPPMPDGIKTAILAFFAVALNEEVLKLGALLIVAYPWSFFNEPFDGIVYAVMVAMGFSAIENLGYGQQFGFETAIVRAITAVPAHLVFAIIVGFYIGKAKFIADRKLKIKKIAKGLLFATLLHGAYDFLLLQDYTEYLYLLAVLGLYLSLYYSSRMIRMRQEDSPFKASSNENKQENRP